MLNNELLLSNIKRLCDNKNIKITNLEKELGFGAGIISRWGNNADPSLSKILDVADYFNISLDELVGRRASYNEFINKLIEKTQKKMIQWNAYENLDSEPKQNHGFKKGLLKKSDIDYYTFHFHEISYYSLFNNGYISIYAQYDDNKITSPNNIKLFIQPTKEAQLIEQKYSSQELYVLWLKVLYSIDEYCPDEIKAEELKNDFINTPENLANEKINDFLSDPSIMKLLETIDTKEFKKVQEVFEDPQFRAALQMLNSMQSYLDNKK